jgi:hypothetical protein
MVTTREAEIVLESCNATWVFDTLRMRFRKVLKGAGAAERRAPTAWRAYHGLIVDGRSESFVVVLNANGTHLLRSWRHIARCPQCGGGTRADLSVGELCGAVLG